MKLTKQGVPDLNQKPVNGRRASLCSPHLPGPLESVGVRWEIAWDGRPAEVEAWGARCLKCGRIVGPIV